MSTIAQELDARLRELDPESARDLENRVREALKAVPLRGGETDAMGYPVGYFEATAGSFKDEPLERPEQLPLEKREDW